jgi:hypothetical protein
VVVDLRLLVGLHHLVVDLHLLVVGHRPFVAFEWPSWFPFE